MVSYAQKPEQIFYARWDIRAFRSVERFEDYKRVKASLIRAPDTAADSNAPRGWKRRWRSFSSDRGLTKTIAYGTIAIVFLTCALLAVALVHLKIPLCRPTGRCNRGVQRTWLAQLPPP